jgi:hypothetical protein
VVTDKLQVIKQGNYCVVLKACQTKQHIPSLASKALAQSWNCVHSWQGLSKACFGPVQRSRPSNMQWPKYKAFLIFALLS